MGDKFVKLIIHHGGIFNEVRRKREYIGGQVDVVEEKFDLDHLSYVNVVSYVHELGLVSFGALWVYVQKIDDFMLCVNDEILCGVADGLKNGENLDIYVIGRIRLFSDLCNEVSNNRTTQVSNLNVIDEDHVKEIVSDGEDDELIAARDNVKKKIEEHGLREKSKNVVPEEAKELVELFIETDELAEGHDSDGENPPDDEEEDDEDEVGSIVSDDDEESFGLSKKDKTITYDPDTTIPIFCLHMAFENVKQVRLAIAKYAIVKGVGLHYYHNDKDRIRVICASGCPWTILVSIERNTQTMQVKTYIPKHKCCRVETNQFATSDNLAFLLKKRISQQPGITVREIKELCRSEYKVKVGWTVCYRVRKKVFAELVGDYVVQYGDLHDYVNEILKSNPGSTCVVESSREECNKGQFLRFYICFKGCRDGFIEGCRKIIGVDGCFLKGLCAGQLLCAIGKDANNQMYPIAWVVVQVENAYNWGWFLRILKHDLQLGDGEGWTIMSDMQKGLDKAIKDELPQIYHRMCARHIYAAWAKKWRGLERKKYFWKCAKSPNENKLKKNMDKLATLGKEIVQDMIDYPVYQWVRAFFPQSTKCDTVDNNICETFNGWILDSRFFPVITMLDEIRRQVMVRIGSRREFARTWICDVSPRAMKRLDRNKIKSYSWQRIWNGDDGHEIISLKNMQVRHVVSLNNWTCTCKEWQVSGIPCRHDICAIYASHKHPEDYVSHLFRKEAYLRTYSHNILPIQGKNGWERLNKDLILPPPFKEKIGRPQTKRHKDKDEPKRVYGKASRKGRKMTCSLCKEQGHTKKTCPQRPRGTKNHNNSMGSGGWILNGERAMSMQNASSFIQMHQATSHPYKEQPGTSSAQIRQQNCASSTSHVTSRTSLLGHIYRGLQWKGHDAITGRELQEINAKKRKRAS